VADRYDRVGPVAQSALPRRPASRLYVATRTGVLILVGTVGVVGVLSFAVSLVLGLRPLVVTSESMEPAIPMGSVVISRTVPATQVQVGGIVTLQRVRGAGPVTSRVVRATTRGEDSVALVLRADAADRDDPEPYVASTAGAYVMQVPWLGLVVMFLEGRAGPPVAILVAVLLLAILVVNPDRGRAPAERSSQGPG